MLQVTLLTASEILFEGEASYVRLPGEQGIFEIGMMHKPLISRLLPGVIRVDRKPYSIRHGIVKVKNNRVVVMVEADLTPYEAGRQSSGAEDE